MDILYTLIPLSILLVFAILVALAWAAHSGQFEDLDVEAERILLDDFAPPPADAPVAAPSTAAPVTGSTHTTDPATASATPASPPAGMPQPPHPR